MLDNLIQAERDQEADCARIDAAVHLAKTHRAALAGPDATHKDWSVNRDRIILTIRDVRHNVMRRADLAKETRKRMIETFFRKKGIVAPSDYSAMIQHIPTNGLLNYLRYLIRIGELERVQGVRAAFENRLDRHPYVSAFEEIVAECALTDSGGDLGKGLARICRLAADADAKIADLWFGHGTPDPANGTAQGSPGEGQPDVAAVNLH